MGSIIGTTSTTRVAAATTARSSETGAYDRSTKLLREPGHRIRQRGEDPETASTVSTAWAESRPGRPREVSVAPMKKGSRRDSDDLRAEYDLASLGPGVRGKYAQRLKGTTLVALQPEVAEAFPTSEAVNEALRAVLKATTVRRRSIPSRKRAWAGRSRKA